MKRGATISTVQKIIIPTAQRIGLITRYQKKPRVFDRLTSIVANYPDLTKDPSKWALRAHRTSRKNLQDDIFPNGIKARGASDSIAGYIKHNDPSVYVSTSEINSEATTAAKFGFGIRSYILLIDRADAITVSVPELADVFRGTIKDSQDETADLADQENELSFVDKVAPERILGARKVYGLMLPYMYTGEFIFNPHYQFSPLPAIQITSKNNKENEDIQKQLRKMGKLPSDQRMLFHDEAQELLSKVRLQLPAEVEVLLPGMVIHKIKADLTLNQLVREICEQRFKELESAKPEPEKADREAQVDASLQLRSQKLKDSEPKLSEKQEKSQQVSKSTPLLNTYTTALKNSEQSKDQPKQGVKVIKTENTTPETDKKSKTKPKQ